MSPLAVDVSAGVRVSGVLMRDCQCAHVSKDWNSLCWVFDRSHYSVCIVTHQIDSASLFHCSATISSTGLNTQWLSDNLKQISCTQNVSGFLFELASCNNWIVCFLLYPQNGTLGHIIHNVSIVHIIHTIHTIAHLIHTQSQ